MTTIAEALRPSCPSCGQPLSPVALHPDTAPWLCPAVTGCAAGFWHAEVTGDGAAHYRAQFRDWGRDVAVVARIRAAVSDEYLAAQGRGTSLREDQIAIATTRGLSALRDGGRIHPAMLEQVEAELRRRGA